MKKIIPALLAITAAFSACKPQGEGDTSLTGLAKNTIVINGTSYALQSSVRQRNGLEYAFSAADASGKNGYVLVFHNGFPTGSGAYEIWSTTNAPYVGLIAFNENTAYEAANRKPVKAQLTVTSGKISVEIPRLWLNSVINNADSVQFYGNVSEQ